MASGRDTGFNHNVAPGSSSHPYIQGKVIAWVWRSHTLLNWLVAKSRFLERTISVCLPVCGNKRSQGIPLQSWARRLGCLGRWSLWTLSQTPFTVLWCVEVDATHIFHSSVCRTPWTGYCTGSRWWNAHHSWNSFHVPPHKACLLGTHTYSIGY